MEKIICKECGKEKYNHGHGVCHTCYMRIQMRERRKKFPEKFRELDKKRWCGKRREVNNRQRLDRHYANRDQALAKMRAYQDQNREKIHAQQKEYYQRNIDVIRAKNREYNKRRDKQKEFARLRAWKLKQPREKIKEIHRRQRQTRVARENNLPHTLTIKEWDEIKAEYDNKCAYCGEKKVLTQDHVLPLSRGGGYVKENIVPACKSCNSKKGNKTAEEFIAYLESQSL